MTKRKLMLVALSLCMVAILAMGGTLAYLTDTSEAINTFTVGDVDITLDEAPVSKEDGTDKWVADEEATRVTENTYTDVYPGAVLPKDPQVHNVGTNDAYVRVQVRVDQQVLSYYGKDGESPTTVEAWKDAFRAFVNGTLDETNWVIVGVMYDADTASMSFIINYKDRLAAKADTTKVFTEIKVFEGWDNEEVQNMGIGKGTDGVQIHIFAEAVQAEGFENYNEAFDAYRDQEFPSNE